MPASKCNWTSAWATDYLAKARKQPEASQRAVAPTAATVGQGEWDGPVDEATPQRGNDTELVDFSNLGTRDGP